MKAAFAVSIACLIMKVFNIVNPPSGAVALLAIIGSDRVTSCGFVYVLMSVLGASILLVIAIIGNNLLSTRPYPNYW